MAKKTTKKTTKKSAKKPAKKSATKKTATKKAAPKKTANKKQTKSAPKTAVAALKVGEVVPDFEVNATGGKTVRLSELRPKKVVLFFYPKDMTPGCTIEGHDFTQLKPEFEKEGAVVFGISRDSVASHEKFKAKENYTIDLLSDEDQTVCNAFSVIKDKNMYGKMVKGVERSTFVIDSEGRLEKEWRGVKVPNHAQEVLEYVKSHK